jgi:hypothetical protein
VSLDLVHDEIVAKDTYNLKDQLDIENNDSDLTIKITCTKEAYAKIQAASLFLHLKPSSSLGRPDVQGFVKHTLIKKLTAVIDKLEINPQA